MKKLIFLIPVFIIGYIFFTGQDFQSDTRRWNPDPRMTRVNFTGEYAQLPQNNVNIKFSDNVRHVITPSGDMAITPNFMVHPSFSHQSETPITRHPTNPLIMFGSANTYPGGSVFSTGVYVTTNGGVNWFGSDTLNNGSFNSGDPGPVIDKDGRFFMSYITLQGTIGVSYSTDNGIVWAPTVTLPGSTTSSDKNFSGTDDVPTSPYYGRSYTVYTEFAGTYSNRVVFSYTTNSGVNWSNIAPASPPITAGYFHQGADIKVGPNGEVYVVWANNRNLDALEDSLGFAKSTNGGVNWVVSRSNADNMNGIRTQQNGLFNGIRTNGFPRIDVDKTGGIRNGWIYVVTSEKNVLPATDAADVILHRSTDGGTTWTAKRVNQDTPGNGKYQYTSAVRVDEQGGVNIIYYDTRNTPTNDSAEIYISRSIDGGNTFIDILVSDHKFKPKPISGLAGGYQGDYIGITSANQKLWPYWCEDISGIYQAWTSEISVYTYPLNAFNLTSPPPGTRILSYPNSYIPSNYTWDTSSSTAVYKWVFGSPTIANRKITLPTIFNSITILSGQLDNLLSSLGLAVGDSLVGQWDVYAYRNDVQNDSLSSANGPRTITLKRGVSPLTNFNLISPSSGGTITTSNFDFSNVNFRWSSSGPGVTYKWKFGSPTISVIRLSYTSDISGIDSSFTIANNIFDGGLAGAGLAPGDSLVGFWSVWAYNGFDSVKATQNNALTLKRAPKGDVLILYDSTNANCRISRDSAMINLSRLNYTYDTYNRKGLTATNAVSFRGYKRVLLLGEGSSVMSTVTKDSIKSYLASGTAQVKSKLIIFAEDIGRNLDYFNSAYYDSAFARSTLGISYVADRPGIGGRGITGISINIGLPDSTYGPSSDVIKMSTSVPSSQTFNLYKYTSFPDSMNAVGRVSPTYNVAVFATDMESLRPVSYNPNSFAVKRVLGGGIKFVDEIPTSSEENTAATSIPVQYSLSQNYPNPFNPTTKINFQLPAGNFVSLKIYDALGKEVATLVNEKKDAGSYSVEFNANNFSSGIYFYRLNAGEFTETKRMLLLK